MNGNLTIYNHTESITELILGKHPDRIICGDWTLDDQIVLGSIDGTVTISKLNGETLHTVKIAYEPYKITIDKSTLQDDTINLIIHGSGGTNLYHRFGSSLAETLSLKTSEPEMNKVVFAYFLGDSHLMIGFECGSLSIRDYQDMEKSNDSVDFKMDGIIMGTYTHQNRKLAVIGT